jgi:hypothetical protein
MSAFAASNALICAPVGAKGGVVEHRLDRAAIAGERAALAGFAVAAGELEGQLVREQLVKGQAPARQGGGLQLQTGLRGVQLLQTLPPTAPALARFQRLINPFGQVGRQGEGGLGRAAHDAGGQTRSERIDRLQQILVGNLVRRRNQVGMNDLHFRAETLRLARHHPARPLRQHAAQIIGLRVKKRQVQKARLVAQAHLIGLLHGRAGDVFFHLRLDRDQPADIARIGNRQPPRAVHQAGRRGEQHILHPAAADHLLHQHRQARADAFQRGQVGEEGEENLGTHGAGVSRRLAQRGRGALHPTQAPRYMPTL